MACNQNLLPFLRRANCTDYHYLYKAKFPPKMLHKLCCTASPCDTVKPNKITPYFFSDVVHCWMPSKASDLSYSTRHFFFSFFLFVEILVSEFLHWLFLCICVMLKQSGQYRWLVCNRYLWPSLLKKTPWITAWRIIPTMTFWVSHMFFFSSNHRNPTTRAF